MAREVPTINLERPVVELLFQEGVVMQEIG